MGFRMKPSYIAITPLFLQATQQHQSVPCSNEEGLCTLRARAINLQSYMSWDDLVVYLQRGIPTVIVRERLALVQHGVCLNETTCSSILKFKDNG